jgi:hypothetical protein
MNARHVIVLLIVSAVAVQTSEASRDVETQVFGGEETFAALMSATDVTVERLHGIPVDSEHPYPRDAWDLSCYRRRSPARLSSEQVKEIKNLLTQSSAYGWDYSRACIPDYGVLLTFHSKPEIKVALCFECDMLSVYVGNKIKKGVNKVEVFDSISPRLLAIARAVYPKDSELAKVARSRR